VNALPAAYDDDGFDDRQRGLEQQLLEQLLGVLVLQLVPYQHASTYPLQSQSSLLGQKSYVILEHHHQLHSSP